MRLLFSSGFQHLLPAPARTGFLYVQAFYFLPHTSYFLLSASYPPKKKQHGCTCIRLLM
jgi:hypothetical protein